MPGGYVPPHVKRRHERAANEVSTSMSPRTSSQHASTTSNPVTFDECMKTLTRAEKMSKHHNKRSEALASFEQAVTGLRNLASSGNAGDEVRVALADTLLQVAKETTLAVRFLPLRESTLFDERAAADRAVALCEEAFTLYEQVKRDHLERSNGIATALSAVVEYAAGTRGYVFTRDALSRATAEYDAIVHLLESDSNTQGDMLPALWNAADARLKYAENALELADFDAAKRSYGEMIGIYEKACGFADASQGDDLGGLLYDWGCSVTSFAQCMLKLDAQEDAMQAIDVAIEKLKSASSFSLGAIEPLNAIGDAYQTKAEIFMARGDDNSACESFKLAMSEGFERALRSNASNLDGNIGIGEASMDLGRLCLKHHDIDGSKSSFERAWASYQKAMANTEADPGGCEERFSVVYNAACAANRAGFVDASKELLSMLIICNGTTLEAINSDVDLQQ